MKCVKNHFTNGSCVNNAMKFLNIISKDSHVDLKKSIKNFGMCAQKNLNNFPSKLLKSDINASFSQQYLLVNTDGHK